MNIPDLPYFKQCYEIILTRVHKVSQVNVWNEKVVFIAPTADCLIFYMVRLRSVSLGAHDRTLIVIIHVSYLYIL